MWLLVSRDAVPAPVCVCLPRVWLHVLLVTYWPTTATQLWLRIISDYYIHTHSTIWFGRGVNVILVLLDFISVLYFFSGLSLFSLFILFEFLWGAWYGFRCRSASAGAHFAILFGSREEARRVLRKYKYLNANAVRVARLGMDLGLHTNSLSFWSAWFNIGIWSSHRIYDTER